MKRTKRKRVQVLEQTEARIAHNLVEVTSSANSTLLNVIEINKHVQLASAKIQIEVYSKIG